VDRHHVGDGRDRRHRHDFLRVVAQRLVEAQIEDMRALRDHGDRVAVGRGLLDLSHRDAAALADLELDLDGLTEIFRQHLGDHHAHDLGRGAFAQAITIVMGLAGYCCA
jgi:hypothetical protein